MNSEDRLWMHEEILLLALDEVKGTTGHGWFGSAMGGALFSELVLRKALVVSDDQHQIVSLLKPGLIGEPVLDECLSLVRLSRKEKKIFYWVNKFAKLKDLKNRTARGLVAKGILTEDRGKVLGLFKRTIYPEAELGIEAELRARLHRAIFTDTDTDDLDVRTLVVVAMCNAAEMLSVIFGRKELKPRLDRIQKLTNGHLAIKATKEAVEAIQAAAIVVAMAVPMIAITIN